ncbi:MAG: hypothetical protein E6I08_04445 [Chloroflexi bacterium]|nr:MAG: hypothetical protein E6I08_04445 [Chloroflexota bacterium]
MRTLATQMRLRRLIRVHTDYVERLAAAPADGELARSARARLLGLSQDVRGAWRADLTGAGGAPGAAVLDRHVERTLRLLESVLAELARPAADRRWLQERFQDSALPLLMFLRGLEEAPAELLAA